MIPIDPVITLVCQVDVGRTRTTTQRDQHLSHLQQRVASQLQHKKADLVVLPELVSMEYSNDAFSCLADLAEPLKGASFETWSDVSGQHQCHIVYSFPLKTDLGNYQIASALSWHSFACTRALENQVYLVSVNRAGADYGRSIVVPPWVDEDHPTTVLSEHKEDFVYMKMDKDTIDTARAQYPFLKDRKDHI